MKGESTRNDVCNKYEQYARWRIGVEPGWLEPLKGKVLACHCYPKRCHAETLVRLIDELDGIRKKLDSYRTFFSIKPTDKSS